MGYKSKYKGSEIDSLLDKAKNDYTVKQYTDYAGYNADTSRPSNTISLIQQDQSVVVGGKRYSQNAECYVGSNVSGISTTGNWFLAGEATITNARDVNVVGIVQHAITSGRCGIFALGLRGYSESASTFNFSWLCKSGTVPLLRVVINGHTVKLYCKVYGGQYQYAHIRLLDQCNQYEANNYKTSFFTLADSTTIIPEADMPSGTDIADVPYLSKDGNAASATKATQDGNGIVIAGNYQRVYKSTFKVTTEGWYKLAYKNNHGTGMAWKDRYIVVSVMNSQGGPTSASFKILYNSQGGWLVNSNNDFMCMPLTGTNYACVTNVRLLSNNSSVSGKTYIEVYLKPAGTTTELSVNIESNIPDAYLYNTATTGETDTSAYDVITRNARTAAHGGSSAVGGLIAEKALKLATPRKIGFANFDGTADLSLNVIQGAFNVRWSSSGTLKPNQWIRFMRMKFSQAWSSVSITLAMEEYEQHRFRGIINFTAWVGSDITPYAYNSRAVWYSLYQVDKNSFGDVTQYIRMVPVAPTDNDANGYVDVYVMSPLGAISYGWHVINDRQVNNASFTLKADTTAIIDNENFPTSYKSSGFQGVLATGDDVEYGTWVTKATTATNADVANKTKYPIVFKRNGASITNWFANTTFVIDIPEELLDYSAPTGITLKVPEISVANEAKKVSNDLEIRVNGKQKATFDGSSAKTVNIEASRSHFVKASMYGEGWISPPAGATTPGVPLILDTSYMIPFGTLQDGDTIIMQVPNTLTSTSGYPVYLRLDTTEGNVAGNLVKIIKGQNAGTPVEWKGTTALTAGYYHFVYSEGAGGLIFMYRNVSTS